VDGAVYGAAVVGGGGSVIVGPGFVGWVFVGLDVGVVVGVLVVGVGAAVVAVRVGVGAAVLGGGGGGIASSPTPARGGKSMTFCPCRAPCMNAVQILTGYVPPVTSPKLLTVIVFWPLPW
jgi:hypothetical protein